MYSLCQVRNEEVQELFPKGEEQQSPATTFYMTIRRKPFGMEWNGIENRTEQDRTQQDRTEQDRTELRRTEQNKI